MGVLGHLAGCAGKAVAKKAAKAVSYPAARAIGNAIDRKAEARREVLMEDGCFPLKLRIQQNPSSVKDRFKVFDAENVIAYQIVGKFFSATPSLVVYDARGQKVGCLRKKIFTLRSPLDRYDGDNIEFEIEIQGEVLGSLRNKKLGGAFDGPLQKMSDSKEGFAGKRYEYDFADWTLIDRTLSSGFDIVSGEGKRFAKIERNSWERGDSYVLSYSSKKDEILLLMMLLAMDALYDTETKKDKVSRAVWLGSSPR